MASKKESIPLTYKGHPLRRKDNLIYYGDMADSHIILLQILETKPVNGWRSPLRSASSCSSPPPT